MSAALAQGSLKPRQHQRVTQANDKQAAIQLQPLVCMEWRWNEGKVQWNSGVTQQWQKGWNSSKGRKQAGAYGMDWFGASYCTARQASKLEGVPTVANKIWWPHCYPWKPGTSKEPKTKSPITVQTWFETASEVVKRKQKKLKVRSRKQERLKVRSRMQERLKVRSRKVKKYDQERLKSTIKKG